jgi:hypothetical protein
LTKESWERLCLLLSTLLMAEAWEITHDLPEFPPQIYHLDRQVLNACATSGIDLGSRTVRKASSYAQVSVARVVSTRLTLDVRTHPLFHDEDLEIIAGSLHASVLGPELESDVVLRLVGPFVVFHRALLQALLPSINEDLYEAMALVSNAFFQVAQGRELQSPELADADLRGRILANLRMNAEGWRAYGERVRDVLLSYLPVPQRGQVATELDRRLAARWASLPQV